MDTVIALGLFCLKGLQANQGDHMELTRLKMSLMYVRTIKTFRLLFMSLLSMGICLIFLLVGLILFHVSLFFYAPWSMETKMLVGFLSSAIYLLATSVVIFQDFCCGQMARDFSCGGHYGSFKTGGCPK